EPAVRAMRPIMRAVRLAFDPTLFGGASERIAPQGTDFRYPWPVDPRSSNADRTDTSMSILSTRVRAVEFLALMCVALSVAAPVAHLVSLPNKIDVPRDAYFVMQRVYDGWWVLGLPWVGAVCLSALAAFVNRRDRRTMLLWAGACALML